jgi:hypothetical protein
LLAGYKTTATVNGEEVAFSGQGGYAACKQSIVAHVVQTQHPCNWSHCAFNGVFQPTLAAGDLHLNKEFFELSAFVFTVRVRPASPCWLLPQTRCRSCLSPPVFPFSEVPAELYVPKKRHCEKGE